MTFIFYLLSIFPLAWEICVLREPKRIGNFLRNYEDKKKYHTPQEFLFAICCVGYLVWNLIGLLTVNLLAFAGILILSLAKPNKFKYETWYLRIDSFLTICLILFIMLNKFHFHFNLTNYFLSLIR